MKKLLLTDFKQLRILDVPIPEPEPGQVVIRMRYALALSRLSY